MFIYIFFFYSWSTKIKYVQHDYELCSHNYGHKITYNQIYNLVFIILVVGENFIVTKVQIWLHDYNQ
jgi:hypothetical protein